MTRYRLEYQPAAVKDLRAIRDKRIKLALQAALDVLTETPRPPGCLKMTGFKNLWRVRVGDWRIIYRIEDARLVVLVVTVAPRGGVYG